MQPGKIVWLSALLLSQATLLLAGPVEFSSEEQPAVQNVIDTTRSEKVKDEEAINSELPKDKRDRLYGGDIMLTDEQKYLIKEMEKNQREHAIGRRAVTRSFSRLWPNQEVPYAISSSLGSSARRAIYAAIAEYERLTCLRFVQRTNQRDHVYFIRDDGCWSFIGRTGGRQYISIGRGCEYTGIAIHEIFHALGRWHEQSRPDRDSYVRIRTENIERDFVSNFEKVSLQSATTQNIPYDFYSVMHYDLYSFSRNGRITIEPLAQGLNYREIGQRSRMTDSDLKHVRTLYCDAQVQTGQWSGWSAWSSCSATCGSGQQIRTRSCIGGTDCDGHNREFRSCYLRVCSRWSSWSQWSPCSVSCGTGIRVRSRTCTGGNDCVGSSQQTAACITNTQCPTWSEWTEWSPCPVTCGSGVQIRTRLCTNGPGCSGNSIDRRTCVQPSCPGVLTQWSDWSSCSKSCGAGVQTRTRTCENGICSEALSEQKNCMQAPLCQTPVYDWSEWSVWSQCSASCGFYGHQSRTRECLSNYGCEGPNKEVRRCNYGNCPKDLGNDHLYGEWSSWNRCNRKCGFGVQFRRRTCLPGEKCRPHTQLHLRGCNYESCSTPPPPTRVVVSPSEDPFTIRDYTAISCHEVDIQTGIPDLYTLNEDSPFTSDIVTQCLELAAENGFRIAGVSGGYCISGSNSIHPYTAQPVSTQCANGVGILSSTSLEAHMEVYKITPA